MAEDAPAHGREAGVRGELPLLLHLREDRSTARPQVARDLLEELRSEGLVEVRDA